MFLMHKDTPVAEISYINGVMEYERILKRDELPVGTIGNGKIQEQILLNHWYKSRSIPKNRPNMAHITQKLGIERADMFMHSSGISITDTYWFKEESDDILWKDVNYHDNGFEPLFASVYLNTGINGEKIPNSPDFTTDGIMEKFWFISQNKPYLAKTDSLYGNTLSANEIVYYNAAKLAGVQTTPYTISSAKGKDYCICPCFINDSSEDYISMMQIKHSDFSLSGENLYYFLFKEGYEDEVRKMITLDVFFHNKDRHEKNFGMKKTNNGLKMIAPFDNGFCLGADRQFGNPITDNDLKLFSCSRAEILDRFGVPLNLDNRYIENLLQSVYEQFNIPEERYDIAKEELQEGFNLIAGLNLSKYIPSSITKESVNTLDNAPDKENENIHEL